MKFSINACTFMHFFFWRKIGPTSCRTFLRNPYLIEHSYVRRNRLISPAFFLVQILSYKNKFCMFLPLSHFFSSSHPQSTNKNTFDPNNPKIQTQVFQLTRPFWVYVLAKIFRPLSARLGLLPIYDQKKTKKTPRYRS